MKVERGREQKKGRKRDQLEVQQWERRVKIGNYQKLAAFKIQHEGLAYSASEPGVDPAILWDHRGQLEKHLSLFFLLQMNSSASGTESNSKPEQKWCKEMFSDPRKEGVS